MNPFQQLALRYGPQSEFGERGPEMFVREVLGAEPDEWQTEALRAYGRAERHISIRSCHGVGKTTLLSWLILYQLVFLFPQKTVATAPSKAQLEDALVAEVIKWFGKMPQPLQDLFEQTVNRIVLRRAPKESFFSARTSREENPEALQGIHSAHVLLIGDEASGIPEKIFEAAVGSMSGGGDTGGIAITVLAGNPVRTTGLFYESHNRLAADWYRIHVTGVKQENHDAKQHGYYSQRVSAEFVEEVGATYGDTSNAFRIRVLGEFPKGDLDTVIPVSLIFSAQERDIYVPKDMPEIWGLDVARFGDDENVLARRSKLEVLARFESWTGKDTMQTTGRVKKRWDETPPEKRPCEILVDVIGIGAGVVDRLMELGLPARGINVSETDGVDDQYRNLRTELWYKCKNWLEEKARKLPKRCECERCLRLKPKDNHVTLLIQELAAQRVDYTSTGKMLCFPKVQMKKALKRSPNIADAVMLTFAGEIATMIHGSSAGDKGYSWNEPIRLKRAVV